MTQSTTKPSSLNIPNLLTFGRIAAVPLLVASMLLFEGDQARWVAALVFVIASVSDFFDGYLARAWDQQSALGRMLDPIADKLLVGTALMMLVHNDTIRNWSIIAGLIILCREILVSGLREFLAELQVKLHVSWLAKWKTVMQMIAFSVLLAGPAAERLVPGVMIAGIILLWLAALMTVWTGYGYLRAAVDHALRN
ncbi:MAG TPA: CDP-diacylglycerol--glycerol-3-phosphate 3-phosphatidyltransferase [Hyphomicrobiaceae bacterium]|nr:CDP-diacylglycerol--glycerol-3-phosphate 3-phosphatidyltransferase [Hyphomicrobiaceae bacterium]